MPLEKRRYSKSMIAAGVTFAGILALSGCLPAIAQTAPPYRDLVRGNVSIPRLAEAQADIRRAEGLARQAGASPNPSISVSSENFSGSSAYKGFDLAENTLELSLPIELGDKRSSRIAAGAAEVDAASARATDRRTGFAYDLAVAYATAEASALRVERAEAEVEEATEDARVANALVEAGREAQLRALQSETSLAAMRAELEAARAGKIAAFARLTALSGSLQAFDAISSSLLMRPTSLRPDAASFNATVSPAYLAAQAERNAANLRIRVEQSRALPDVTASIGMRQFSIDDSTAVVARLSIPFPLFDTNRGNTDAARATLDAANARLAGARLEAEAEGKAALANVAASQARVDAAVASEAAAGEAYRLSRVAYENGRASLLELLNARRAAGAARSITIDARLARVIAEATLARLQGSVPFGDLR